MIEAAAANKDRGQAIAALAKRLESLAYVSQPVVLEELLEILRILRSIDPDLGARSVARSPPHGWGDPRLP